MATDKTEDENGRQRSPERSDFICSYTEEEIKELGIIELSDILEENHANYENLVTETEMRELVITLMKKGNRETVKLDNSVTEMIFSSETSQQGAELLDSIFEKDGKRKKCLCDLYDDLKKFMEQETMDTKLIEEMRTEFGNVKGEIEIEKYKNELMEEECPIVVAGETTAGKSSLLNLLLGSDFLPHSLLTCTTTICRLRNKDEKKVLITDKANVTKELDLPVNVDAAWMKSKLKKYVSLGVDYEQCNYVDIHWPIPILKGHTIIVDTPGIGSNDELTKRVYEYLCKAVAFIYVINSSNAGGVQSDRLERIFEVQKEGGKMYDFDPTRTIFVCNKWDQVPVKEDETVWNNTVKKLKDHWPNFSESQMFKLSTKEETRRASTPGLEYTSDFQKLLLGIGKMIPASLEAKVSRHSRWQQQFLEQLLKRIVSRIKLSRKTEDEKKKIKGDIEERIKTLRHNIKQVMSTVKTKAEERCNEISIQLNKHLNSKETKERIFLWSIPELPNGDDMEVIEYKAKEMIIKRINQEIREWCKKKYVNNITQELSDLFNRECKLIDAQCDEINKTLLDISMPLDEHLLDFSQPNPTSHDSLFTKYMYDNIVQTVTTPLWLPFVFGAGLIAVSFGVVVGVKDLVQQTKKMNDYNSNKLKYMMDWSDMVLDKYSKDTIYKLMEDTYLNDFNMKVQFVCENVIPRQIAADEKFINNIKDDIRSPCEIREQYQPLKTSCKCMLGKLLLIYMDYFSGYRLSHNEIRQGEQEIGKGNFSDVHATEILINREWIKAAVKTLRKPLENIQSYIQLTEVQNLRKLHHPNIVELYGVSYKLGSQSKKFLQIYMEFCDDSLDNIVFKKKNPPPCYLFKEINECKDSWEFYLHMMCGVLRGLVHVHGMGIVHRDLKLANILVKNGTAKIADVGLAKEEEDINGTVTGTPTTMAPEALEEKVYGTQADIFSVGIILWEMWYARPGYTDKKIDESGDHITIAETVSKPSQLIITRLHFENKYKPHHSLQVLIKQCWNSNIECPTAENVLDKLEKMVAGEKV